MQAELNIGTFGHVDHGKTTLTKALTGKWTDTHSEEIKRGISIKLGYADFSVYFCSKCNSYSNSPKCPCGGEGIFKRRISIVDSPGHETLMATAISASSIIDGALFLIAANEPCPQAQTAEHLMILDAMKIKNIVIVQTKLDLVSRDRAIQNKKEIENFVKGSVAEGAPIIPIVGTHGININFLLEAIEDFIPTPSRNLDAPLKMYVSRSFDVNRPGTEIEKLTGGVIGGSIVDGKVKVGDEIEIRPGIQIKENSPFEPLILQVKSLRAEENELKEAKAGGLIAVGTNLDPSLTKADALVGSVVGNVNSLPPNVEEISLEYYLLKRKDIEIPPFKEGEIVVINVQTATSVGIISSISKERMSVKLKRPLCIFKNSKVAISRRIGQRWRLSAWGKTT